LWFCTTAIVAGNQHSGGNGSASTGGASIVGPHTLPLLGNWSSNGRETVARPAMTRQIAVTLAGLLVMAAPSVADLDIGFVAMTLAVVLRDCVAAGRQECADRNRLADRVFGRRDRDYCEPAAKIGHVTYVSDAVSKVGSPLLVAR